jgi:hypothetical protein
MTPHPYVTSSTTILSSAWKTWGTSENSGPAEVEPLSEQAGRADLLMSEPTVCVARGTSRSSDRVSPTGERGPRGCGGDQHIRCTFGRRCEWTLISVMNRPAGGAPTSVGRLDSSEPPGAAARAERPDIASRLSQPCMSLRPSNRVISIHGSSPQLQPGRHSAESAPPPRMVLVKSVARRIFRLSSMIVAAPHARSAGCAAH